MQIQGHYICKATKWSEGWNTTPVRKDWESQGCSAWRREDSGETLRKLHNPLLFHVYFTTDKASKPAQELHGCHLIASKSQHQTSISCCLGPARTCISNLTGAINKRSEVLNSFHWASGGQFGLSCLKAVLNSEIKHMSK